MVAEWRHTATSIWVNIGSVDGTASSHYLNQCWLVTSEFVWHSLHYNDVLMGAIAPQITSLTIVYSTVYSDADQRKHQSSASLAFVREFTGTGEFPAQMASNAENVSIWWRHHVERNSTVAARSQAASLKIIYFRLLSRLPGTDDLTKQLGAVFQKLGINFRSADGTKLRYI